MGYWANRTVGRGQRVFLVKVFLGPLVHGLERRVCIRRRRYLCSVLECVECIIIIIHLERYNNRWIFSSTNFELKVMRG